jgi:hypothetical protein
MSVLVIVGIAVAVALIAIVAVYLVPRAVTRRREADRSARTVERPLPSEEGRPWSSER